MKAIHCGRVMLWAEVSSCHVVAPSDTKLLLMNNYSDNNYFRKITNFTRNFLKCLSFLEILRVQNPSKITKNNSRIIILAIVSCQTVRWVWFLGWWQHNH